MVITIGTYVVVRSMHPTALVYDTSWHVITGFKQHMDIRTLIRL